MREGRLVSSLSPSHAPTLRVPGNALLALRHISTANSTLSLHARASRLLTQDPRRTDRPRPADRRPLVRGMHSVASPTRQNASSSNFAWPAKFTMFVRSGDDGGQILALIDSENRRHHGLQ